jgi:hypothetical protein
MLEAELIESYKAQQMKHFLEYWMKICPDHTISIRDGAFKGSALVINIPDSFANKIRFSDPTSEIKVNQVYHQRSTDDKVIDYQG